MSPTKNAKIDLFLPIFSRICALGCRAFARRAMRAACLPVCPPACGAGRGQMRQAGAAMFSLRCEHTPRFAQLSAVPIRRAGRAMFSGCALRAYARFFALRAFFSGGHCPPEPPAPSAFFGMRFSLSLAFGLGRAFFIALRALFHCASRAFSLRFARFFIALRALFHCALQWRVARYFSKISMARSKILCIAAIAMP